MKIDVYSGFQTPNISSGSAERLQALANLGQGVTNFIAQEGGRIRRAQGQKAGQLAGMKAAESGTKPDVQQELFPSLYDEAFQASQESAYLSSVDASATEAIARLADENPYDPEKFKKLATGRLQGYLEDAPAAYQPYLKESISRNIDREFTRVNKRFLDKARVDAGNDLATSFNTFVKEAQRHVRNGDTAAANEALAKADRDTQARLAGGFITEKDAEELTIASRKGLYHQRLKRDILALGETDYAAAAKQLREAEKGDTPIDHSPAEFEAVIDDIRTDLNRLRPAKVSSEANSKLYRYSLKQANALQKNLTPISTGELNELAMLAGDDTVKQKEVQLLRDKNQFMQLGNETRQKIIKAARDGDKSNMDLQYSRIQIESMNDAIYKAMQEDGMMYAENLYGIELAPIDGSTYERRKQQAMISEKTGTEVPLYKQSEIRALTETFADMTPDDLATLAMSFDASDRAFEQFAKADAPLFAFVSERSDHDIAKKVFIGKQRIDEGLVSKPSRSDMQPILIDYLGEVGDVYNAEDYAQTVDAAIYHMAATNKFDSAEQKGNFDEDALKASLEAVTRGIGEINGSKIQLPDDVSEDDLEDFWYNVDYGTINKYGKLFDNLPIEKVRDARLVSRGTNVYGVSIDEGNSLLPDLSTGQPYEITIDPMLIKSTLEQAEFERTQTLDGA